MASGAALRKSTFQGPHLPLTFGQNNTELSYHNNRAPQPGAELKFQKKRMFRCYWRPPSWRARRERGRRTNISPQRVSKSSESTHKGFSPGEEKYRRESKTTWFVYLSILAVLVVNAIKWMLFHSTLVCVDIQLGVCTNKAKDRTFRSKWRRTKTKRTSAITVFHLYATRKLLLCLR